MMFWILVAIACSLTAFAAGYLLGGRRKEAKPVQGSERESMLQLLSELETWTHQYAGDVSQHQDILEALRDSLTRAISGESADSSSREQAVLLLQKLLHSNNDLKKNLETAEREIDDKSKQIKCYLTEARTDGLTDLANRRAFDQTLEELFTAHRRGGRSFAVGLIDVDQFKAINDSHGHPEGDRVLKYLADRLQQELPEALMLARFGGDELAVVLEEPLLQSAEKLDRIRHKIQQQGIPFLPKSGVTISIGVSQPTDDMGAASIIRRADEALYAAKHMGRNRVYYHDGREPTVIGSPQVTQH